MRIFLGNQNITEENKWLVYKKNLGKLINIVPEKVLKFNDMKKINKKCLERSEIRSQNAPKSQIK